MKKLLLISMLAVSFSGCTVIGAEDLGLSLQDVTTKTTPVTCTKLTCQDAWAKAKATAQDIVGLPIIKDSSYYALTDTTHCHCPSHDEYVELNKIQVADDTYAITATFHGHKFSFINDAKATFESQVHD